MAIYYSYQFSWLPIVAAIASNDIAIGGVDIAIVSVVVAIAIANVAIAATSVVTAIAIEISAIIITSVAMTIATTTLAPHIGTPNGSKSGIPASVAHFYTRSVFTIIRI